MKMYKTPLPLPPLGKTPLPTPPTDRIGDNETRSRKSYVETPKHTPLEKLNEPDINDDSSISKIKPNLDLDIDMKKMTSFLLLALKGILMVYVKV